VAIFAHSHLLLVLTARWWGLDVPTGRHFALATATVLSILAHERDIAVIVPVERGLSTSGPRPVGSEHRSGLILQLSDLTGQATNASLMTHPTVRSVMSFGDLGRHVGHGPQACDVRRRDTSGSQPEPPTASASQAPRVSAVTESISYT
jgi:hypothetical protein